MSPSRVITLFRIHRFIVFLLDDARFLTSSTFSFAGTVPFRKQLIPTKRSRERDRNPTEAAGVCEQYLALAAMTWMLKKMNGWPVKNKPAWVKRV
jgi:hypothetical protein